MKIDEALKEGPCKGGVCYRKSWVQSQLVLDGTVLQRESPFGTTRWAPSVDDLTAEDWEAIPF